MLTGADSLSLSLSQDRCQRDRCKYFHPSLLIKHRLVAAGKQFGAMMSNMYGVPSASYPTSAVS